MTQPIDNVCSKLEYTNDDAYPVEHEPLLAANGDVVRVYLAGCSGVPAGKEGDDEIKIRICRQCSCLYLEW